MTPLPLPSIIYALREPSYNSFPPTPTQPPLFPAPTQPHRYKEIRLKEVQREKNVEARRVRMREEAAEKARKRAVEIGTHPLTRSHSSLTSLTPYTPPYSLSLAYSIHPYQVLSNQLCFNTPRTCHSSPLTHPINTPLTRLNTFLTHPINTPLTHPINTPYQHTLSTHL